MDWSLRGCARHGHETFAPSEPDLAARLSTGTPAGDAWRCLRCGTFVVGLPKASGPAEQAPRVLRGKALREATVLRAFAVERWVRAFVLAALGAGVLSFRSSQTSLRDVFDRALPAARPLADVFNVDLSRSKTVEHIRSVLGANTHTLTWIAVALFGYAAIQVAEGIGLWSLKRWGEYLAVVATSVFLPLEIYELSEKVTYLRVGAFVVNLALVGYLVVSKRLFGVRGGAAAYHAERANDSLLEVEEVATHGTHKGAVPDNAVPENAVPGNAAHEPATPAERPA
jgi:uncharacterized membrane protein (DUF2068 family)